MVFDEARRKLREKIEKVVEKRHKNRVRQGMSALHTSDGWKTGSFTVETPTEEGEVRIVVFEENDRLFVRAESDTVSSPEWPIPDATFEAGVESAAFAFHDFKLRIESRPRN